MLQDESQKMLVDSNYVVTNRVEPSAFYTIEKDVTALYSTKSSTTAFSSGHQHQKKYCDFCNMKGHIRADCYKCEHCLQKGHLKESSIIHNISKAKEEQMLLLILLQDKILDTTIGDRLQNVV